LARVSFFSTFDMIVWFGRVPTAPTTAHLVDINPLADHAPNDMHSRQIDPTWPSATITPPINDSAVAVVDLLTRRSRALNSRISDKVWAVSTAALLDSINATRSLPPVDRSEEVAKLLEPCTPYFLHLAHRLVELLGKVDDANADRRLAVFAMKQLVTTDPTASDGLGPVARASMGLVRWSFSEVIANELDAAPMTDGRFRLLLEGRPGLQVVCDVLLEHVAEAIGRQV
jgi:hypothetical protein